MAAEIKVKVKYDVAVNVDFSRKTKHHVTSVAWNMARCLACIPISVPATLSCFLMNVAFVVDGLA